MCPNGYFNSLTTSTCIACPFKCLTCSDSTTCLTCRGDRILSMNCICPEKFFDDNVSLKC